MHDRAAGAVSASASEQGAQQLVERAAAAQLLFEAARQTEGSTLMPQEPCMSFVLKDVVCSQCNNSRDLDLCRDPDLQVRCLPDIALSTSPMLSRDPLQRHGPGACASAGAAALDIMQALHGHNLGQHARNHKPVLIRARSIVLHGFFCSLVFMARIDAADLCQNMQHWGQHKSCSSVETRSALQQLLQ